jgi:hypothetical protein
MGAGWEVMGINERMGGLGRPDVVDLYTGTKRDVMTPSGPESSTHNQKGWAYSNEPQIARLISQGYRFDYAVLPSQLVQ